LNDEKSRATQNNSYNDPALQIIFDLLGIDVAENLTFLKFSILNLRGGAEKEKITFLQTLSPIKYQADWKIKK